jgi:hypothetical protein
MDWPSADARSTCSFQFCLVMVYFLTVNYSCCLIKLRFWDSRFSRQWRWWLLSSGLWLHTGSQAKDQPRVRFPKRFVVNICDLWFMLSETCILLLSVHFLDCIIMSCLVGEQPLINVVHYFWMLCISSESFCFSLFFKVLFFGNLLYLLFDQL